MTTRPRPPAEARETWEIRFRIEGRPRPGDPGIAPRVKRLLKYALRVCGLRCTAVRDVTADTTPDATGGPLTP